MRNRILGFVVLAAVVAMFAGSAICARSGKTGGDGDFAIYVAPATIVKAAPCPCVTIHTNVPFGSVLEAEVAVSSSSVDIEDTFADDCGNLVVKLQFGNVVDVIPEGATSATVALGLAVQVNGEVVAKAASETVAVK